MKKIIVGIFTFVFLFTGVQSIFAAGPFNGQSGDCPNIAIGNYTTGTGIGDGQWNCWTKQSVSASAGDTINVALFYHNNTSNTLTNVEASLTQSSSGPTRNYSFSGKMYSDQGDTSLGTVNLTLDESQTLTYSSAHWMKDKDAIDSDIDSTMLYGQSGSVMKNGGRIRLGSVPSGWEDYGYILVVFKVGASSSNNNNTCFINDFSANDTSIEEGDSVKLSWDTTSDCDSVYISGIGIVDNDGNYTTKLYSDRTFKMTAEGDYGSDTESVTIRVNQDNNDDDDDECRIVDFDADDTSIDEGDETTIEWETDNCTKVNISGIGNNLRKDGEEEVSPSSTRSYKITAYGDNGSDSDSITIYVDEDNNDDDDEDDDYNTPSVTTYIPTNITDTGARISGYATGNGSKINTWLELPCYGKRYGEETNKTYTSLSASVYSLLPNTTYNYCAVAQNRTTGQIHRGNVISFTTINGGNVTYSNTNVVTTVATNISTSSAQLNGLITNSSYSNQNVYFEYGTTVNLGLRTGSKVAGGTSTFSDVVNGLSSNTIYFFRAVSDGSNGTSRGAIEIFKTLSSGNTVVRTIVQQGTTVIGSSSPVMLEITNRYQLISEGDFVDYVVTYKNISKSKLTKPMIQVVLPTNITLVNSSRGTYSVDTHTLSAPIDDLSAGEEGVMYLQGRVDSIPVNNSQIATTAILIYTSSNGAQENAMAYVLNVPKITGVVLTDDASVLAGAALGGFFSIGLIGWLIIILIILILILIVRSAYSRNHEGPHTPTH